MMFSKKLFQQNTVKAFLLLFAFSAMLNSCSNDFALTADWKSIPVIYAILSNADTAHYVRVEKAFLDESTSAKTLAQIPDSLYYGADEIQVYIERVSNGQKTLMRRVDGVLEGIPRKSGIFATSPNWLYKVLPSEIGNLQLGEKYRIIVERTDGNPITFGETTTSKLATIAAPEPNAQRINMFPNSLSSYQWQADTSATLFNVTLQVPIRMLKANGQLVRIDTLYWQAAKNIESGTNFSGGQYVTATKISGAGFYQFLSEELHPFAVQDTFRYFGKVRIILDGGGREITNFQISASANSGVTGAEIVPLFSNVTNGLGVVSSKTRTISGEYFVQQQTLDSVRVHPLTSNLNFSL